MISEKYEYKLLREVKRIDALLGQKKSLENLVNQIINDENDKDVLVFIKALSDLNKLDVIKNFSNVQEELIGILSAYLGGVKIDSIFSALKETSSYSLKELRDQLDELVGLRAVKQQVEDLVSYNMIQNLRVKSGLNRSDKTLHMAFIGNPGTAKTTVARIIGRMYKSMGLLSKGHFIEVSRTDLIAEYQGQTAIKVKKLVNRARGGVLFIDEAYSITENSNSDAYGRECITELIKALEDYRDDLVVIVAGYAKLMDNFFESNPGLKSRFNTFISFDDYSLEELVDIFKYICKKNDYVVEENAINKIRELIEKKLNEKDSNFSNARFIRNIFDDVVMNQSKRLARNAQDLNRNDLMLLVDLDVLGEESKINY